MRGLVPDCWRIRQSYMGPDRANPDGRGTLERPLPTAPSQRIDDAEDRDQLLRCEPAVVAVEVVLHAARLAPPYEGARIGQDEDIPEPAPELWAERARPQQALGQNLADGHHVCHPGELPPQQRERLLHPLGPHVQEDI